MATTQKGIYYPDDYTAIADVPEDMKDLAESVDTALDTKVDKEEGKGLSTYNFGTVSKGRLDSLWNNKGNIESNIARIKATLPTTTGSGENITLDKTAELDFIQPPLPRGNTSQVQYSGKNKLPVNATSQTINGITFTVNEDKTIKVNGTASANTVFNLYGNLTIQPGTYIFNGTPSGGSWGTYSMGFGDKNDSGSGSTFTVTEEFTGQPYIRIASGTTINNLLFKPMLRLSSVTDTTYEPYVGGTASPNPSYPQEITNVTGDVEVVVSNADDTETQTFTFPLGTQRMYLGDYLADDGIHHVRGEYTVTGNESIGNFEIASNGCFAVTLGIKCKYGVYSGDETYWLADKLKAYSLAKLRGSTPKIGICVLNDGFTYVNLTGEASTRESAIASWNDLAGMKIEYLMQEEEITPYTTEQQQAYDEIKQALSYEEQTNISGTSDEANPLFSVEAYQSIKLILAS